MTETTQIPQGTWMLSKFMGTSVKQMIGLGLSTEDAVFIESLKWMNENKQSLRQMQLELVLGNDQKLHVSELHPLDGHQAAVLAQEACYPGEAQDPEIKAMQRIRGNEHISIIDAQVTEKLKKALPYHFTLSGEDFRPPLTRQDAAVYRALDALCDKDDVYRSQVDFVVRQGDDATYRIEKIELYPLGKHLSPTLKRITEMANAAVQQTEDEKSVIVIADDNLNDLRREALRNQPGRDRG